jgi:Tannase and feruloyl esterase
MQTTDPSRASHAHVRVSLLFSLAASAIAAGCGGGDNAPAPTPAPAPAVALTCDDSMKTAFKPDANTTVLLVKAFKKGDPIALSGTPTSPAPPTAAHDLCLVKLNVGPGHPGPAGAPSTAAGIAIEVWLPAPANWNQRIHNLGNGGWAGGLQSSLTQIGSGATGNGAQLADTEGSVTSSSDDGNPSSSVGVDSSFLMNPDGTINSVLWQDFADRALHEQAVKTKALVQAYYLQPQKFAYWDGCSTGGRQGYKEVQNNPSDYDGYLIGAPAINWTKFITAELYPQIVNQRDLGGVGPTPAQDALVSGSAVSTCDVVGGQHLGYLQDPSTCNYDPSRDASVLCAGTTSNGVIGTNATAACVSPTLARAYNKYWFGQTADGSASDPSANNGFTTFPTGGQLWFGLTRGTDTSSLAGPVAFFIAADQVALELQNPTIGEPTFLKNATGNGANGWMSLSYGGLANAFAQGVNLQSFFGNINTDNADLSGVKQSKAKILHYHGLSDIVIFPQGSINYYIRVANLDGGFANTQQYDRLFLIPAMGHCAGIGSVSGRAGVSPPATLNSIPLPAAGQLFSAMANWVENGTAPASITLSSANASASQLLCPYPQKPTYSGTGSIASAGTYTCK